MRILIANVTLATRTGTETATRDLAAGLLAAGHEPTVYSRSLGDIANEIGALGIRVVSDLSSLPEAPDIIHGNHHVETIEALLHFPGTPGVFVCHDRTATWSAPPSIGRIRYYVAVDHYCLERLTGDYGIPPPLTRVIYNSVDTDRFVQRPSLPPRPRRALVFSNYAGPGTHMEAIQKACAALDIELDVLGAGSGRSSDNPEQMLAGYDVVFAKARCAIEAMASGTAVVLCDTTGLGPMVTLSNVESLRHWNFGRRALQEPLEPERLIAHLHGYDADDALAVSAYIRELASLSSSTEQYLQLYAETLTGYAETLAAEQDAPKPVAEELNQYLVNTATRIRDLEEERARLTSLQQMAPLSNRACEQVSVRITECPHAAVADAAFRIRVEVLNGGLVALGSYPPHPVHLSYRWFSCSTGEIVVSEGTRTPLRPPAAPGVPTSYSMTVKSPARAGEHRLRLTLVQETVAWFDALPHPVCSDTHVLITPLPRDPVLPDATHSE
ncbi:MAG: glycosyltransferase [Vicinamibacterales bacterium]